MFVEESLVPLLAQVILRCYCEYSELIVTLTSQLVNKKLIANDDKMYDLMNYVIGTIKCFTQTSKEVQRITVQSQMISVLSKALHKTFVFGGNQNKQSMILVQISGALRNLANVEDSYGLLLTCKDLWRSSFQGPQRIDSECFTPAFKSFDRFQLCRANGKHQEYSSFPGKSRAL